MDMQNLFKSFDNKHEEIISEMSFLRRHGHHHSMIAKNDETKIRAIIEYIAGLPDISNVFICLDSKKECLNINTKETRKSDILRACPKLSHKYKS